MEIAPGIHRIKCLFDIAGNLESLTKRGLLRIARNTAGLITWRLA